LRYQLRLCGKIVSMTRFLSVKGKALPLPLFLPVFELDNPFVDIDMLGHDFGFGAIMTNAFFLYKHRERKAEVLNKGIHEFLGFDGIVVTDSGAFQQFSGPLYLKNKTIVAFQRDIGVDVISPLDLITPPGDKRTVARKKMLATIKRIEQVLPLSGESTLIGVGQGGRFLDLRGQAMEMLAKLGVSYAALGALVPFFNRNHDMEFVGRVIRQARAILPKTVPIHLYGGGDPLELPFYMALGCDIFDSSSFVHYAKGGWYMTPYGALKREEMDLKNPPYCCCCPQCAQGMEKVYQDTVSLARHNLWVIVHTMKKAGELLKEGLLNEHLMHIAAKHMELFPSSRLAGSWQALELDREA